MKIRWIAPIVATTGLALGVTGCGNSTGAASGQGASAKPSESTAAKKQITEENVPEMTLDEVEAGITAKASNEAALYVFDVNPKDVYDEGHVPTAKWVPKKVTAEMLPADKAAKLVFYCANEH